MASWLERPYLARAILLCAASISFVLRQAALHAVPHVLLQILLRKYSNSSVPKTVRGRQSQADRQSSIKISESAYLKHESEPVFLNFYGAQESIPPAFVAWPVRQPNFYWVLFPHRLFQNSSMVWISIMYNNKYIVHAGFNWRTRQRRSWQREMDVNM